MTANRTTGGNINREWIRLRRAYGATGRELTRIRDFTADERGYTQIRVRLIDVHLRLQSFA